ELLDLTAPRIAARLEQELRKKTPAPPRPSRSNGAPAHFQGARPAGNGHPSSPRVPQWADLEAVLDLGRPLTSGALGPCFAQALLAPLQDFLGHPGKAIRAQLVEAGYALARALEPAARAGGCAGLAECVELIHAGSLIVDDIQDDSRVRRGR